VALSAEKTAKDCFPTFDNLSEHFPGPGAAPGVVRVERESGVHRRDVLLRKKRGVVRAARAAVAGRTGMTRNTGNLDGDQIRRNFGVWAMVYFGKRFQIDLSFFKTFWLYFS
jgi:hypothetical protein